MREIEFRGKRLDNGEWVYGYYHYTFDRDYYSQGYDDVPCRCHYIDTDCRYFEVDPETVGQYTGLKDENGVKIYEGDILKYAYTENDENWGSSEVTWCGDVDYPAFDLKVHSFETNALSEFVCVGYLIEIIGNIHDKVSE